MHRLLDGGSVRAWVEGRRGTVIDLLQFLREIFVGTHELVIVSTKMRSFLRGFSLPLVLKTIWLYLSYLIAWRLLLSRHGVASPAAFILPLPYLIPLLDLPLQLLLVQSFLALLIV